MEQEKKRRGRPKVCKEINYIPNTSVINPPMLSVVDNQIKKQKNKPHRFKKGNTASTGRPKGSRNKSTLMLEAIGTENAAAVYQKLVDLALGRTKEGDINACKIILDRAYPAPKGRTVALEFDGPVKTIQDANNLSEHITTMIITGELSAEEAEDYGKWIDRRTKSIIDSDVMDKMNSTMEKVKNTHG